MAQERRRSWIPLLGRVSGKQPVTADPAVAFPFTMSSSSQPATSKAKRPLSGSGWAFRRPGSKSATPLSASPLATPRSSSPVEAAPTPSLPSRPLGPPSGPGKVRVPRRPATSDGTSHPPSTAKRWRSSLLTPSSPQAQSFNGVGTQELTNALERISSQQPSVKSEKPSSSFSKSLSSMIGLSSLSLSRTSTRDSSGEDHKERGRSMLKLKRYKSASQAPDDGYSSRSQSRARSQSPFFRRWRSRESSPTPQALPLNQSEAELSDAPSSMFPRNTAYTDDDSGDETFGTDAETDDAASDDEDVFDDVTERNTEQNALIAPVTADPALALAAEAEDPDPVGEGPNVVVPPEPYFPSTLNATGSMSRGKRSTPRRRKTLKTHEPLPFATARPHFQRDRCTLTLTQGDPEEKLGSRRKHRYVVASDLSEESRYAVEWGIGTVLRDGDEMLIVTVVENDSKVDPLIANPADRTTKVRAQQERQGLAYILVRQATSLLQRTRLNVTIHCQAWHAKNSRHMLLDIVDHVEPTMLIVGSRGLGQLNGILLGSTSHYLIQKCSVPVMVARRRLKRPPKKSAHLSTHRIHVSLAEAGIDRVAAKVDEDVKIMRDEIQKDDNRRDGGPGSRDGRFATSVPEGDNEEEGEGEGEDENDDEPPNIKVAG